ncbi:MAG: hypothetical protein QME81_08830, partial [bacterium]|nr:hypothetical protein [bacterium]
MRNSRAAGSITSGEVRKLGAGKIIFNCSSCYSMWQQEYQPEGIDLIYRESVSSSKVMVEPVQVVRFRG